MPTTPARIRARRLPVLVTAALAGAALVSAALAGCSATPVAEAPVATPAPTAETATPEGASPEIEGLITFPGLTGVHVEGPVDYLARYGMNPPAGGDHWAGWLNCGVYDQPQQNERAVHALEHGAVWVTYNPDEVTADGVASLRASLPDTYIVLSPFPELPAPVVASAWGYQVQLDGADDPRLSAFVNEYWQSPNGPEPGAPCTGGIDGPGLVP